MANENNGFAKLMRWCLTTADFEAAKTAGTVTDDVLVIVIAEKLAKFKGETFDWSGGGGGVNEEVIIENEEITAAALTDINKIVCEIKNYQENNLVKVIGFNNTINSIIEYCLRIEEITAASLTDINKKINQIQTRLNYLESK